MNLLRRHKSNHPRGQGLVEMAIILPLLALMLVMAVDFGRVFFGWVALNNAARIGADTAASYAQVWNGGLDGDQLNNELTKYRERVRQDLQALGCQDNPVPDPIFDTDVNGDGDFFSDGDLARVELACEFPLLTPLAEAAVGGPVTLHAKAEFAINQVINGGMPAVEDLCEEGQGLVPDMVGERMQGAAAMWVDAGFAQAGYTPAVTNANKNRTVLTQTLTEDSCAELTATVIVTFS
ncbi:MAG: TadE family protein [Candidatus Limnocylindria bacterium]